MFKLRWFRTCDENGVKTEPELQYWDEDLNQWETVPYVECKDYEEEDYMSNPNAVF